MLPEQILTINSNLDLNQEEEWIYPNPLQTFISITCQLRRIKSLSNLSKTEYMEKRLCTQQWWISFFLFFKCDLAARII